jgi:methyl-accepting chemotaxis protein
VTEPPEPRHPEEGGGEDDFLGELDDDMLLDALGRGEDEAGELGDMLGTWRDDVESEPVGPIAENAQEIHELNQQYDRPAERPTPPAPETGGTMSQLSDLANQVASHVDMSEILGVLAQAEQMLQDKQSALQALLDDTQHVGAVMGAGAEASQAIANALPAVNNFGEAISQAAGAIRGG